MRVVQPEGTYTQPGSLMVQAWASFLINASEFSSSLLHCPMISGNFGLVVGNGEDVTGLARVFHNPRDRHPAANLLGVRLFFHKSEVIEVVRNSEIGVLSSHITGDGQECR